MRKFFKVLAFLFVLKLTLYGQTERIFNPIADSLFKSGLELFTNGLNVYTTRGDTASFGYFLSAYLNFDSVISLGLNHRTSASYLMASKSLCYLNRFGEARKLLNEFLRNFPESRYVEDAFYTLGLIQIKLRNFREAILSLDNAIKRSSSSNKVRYVKIVSVIVDSLDLQELKEIENSDLSQEVRYLVVAKAADMLVSLRKIEDAKKYIADKLVYFQGTEYYEKLMMKISYFERLLVRPSVKIGVLLPKDRDLSRSILRGIELGVEEHNLNSGLKVGLEVRYYTSSDIDQKLLEFKNYSDVIGIIGPIYSEDVELCARFAGVVKVPIISPTATSDGLAKLNDYIFQFNSDYATRSKALAQFAIFALGLKYFLILAPNDKGIKPFVDAFLEEVKKNSASVIDIQFYNSNETDLRPYFRNMLSKIDSFKILAEEISSEGIGLFAPILDPNFIGIISSQVYYHDLKVKILGNDLWNNYSELYMNKGYTDGAIFTSGQYLDFESLSFKNFSRLFREKFNSEPDEFSVYGYDSVKLLLGILEEGKLTAAEVYKALENYEITGVGRDVIFDGSRVNSSISILVFKDNLIKRISKWVLSK